MMISTRNLVLVVFWCGFTYSAALRLPVPAKQGVLHPEMNADSFLKFEHFRRDFNKTYENAKEALKRYKIFVQNLVTIEELNVSGMGTAEYGVNEMSDWTEEEFLKRRANLNPADLRRHFDTMEKAEILRDVVAPVKFDWRDKKAVTPAKNQGQCGSCWAFSVVGNIENCCKIKRGADSDCSFSEQQLVDCDKKSSGCNGGWMNQAIEYIKRTGGSMTEASYPYEERTGSCRFNSSGVGIKVDKNQQLAQRNEKNMANYVSQVSSVSNAIHANRLLQNYQGGIIDPSSAQCPTGSNSVNHAVIIVGYGSERTKNNKTIPFWVMKNSWGRGWGENGFFRIRRGTNACGISHYVNSVVLADS